MCTAVAGIGGIAQGRGVKSVQRVVDGPIPFQLLSREAASCQVVVYRHGPHDYNSDCADDIPYRRSSG